MIYNRYEYQQKSDPKLFLEGERRIDRPATSNAGMPAFPGGLLRSNPYDRHSGYPIEATTDVIGGKWKGAILFNLIKGKVRFNEIRKRIPEVTQRILVLQLRELERDGLIARMVHAESPLRVEYELTRLGATLKPIILQMSDWGAEYMKTAARDRQNSPKES